MVKKGKCEIVCDKLHVFVCKRLKKRGIENLLGLIHFL